MSAEFPEFYQRGVLSELYYLSRVLSNAVHKDPKVMQFQQAEIEFVQLKYQRKVMKKPETGLREAVAWSESGNADIQRLAIAAFEEIPGTTSLLQLERLAKSPDQGVSGSAKNALVRLRQKK